MGAIREDILLFVIGMHGRGRVSCSGSVLRHALKVLGLTVGKDIGLTPTDMSFYTYPPTHLSVLKNGAYGLAISPFLETEVHGLLSSKHRELGIRLYISLSHRAGNLLQECCICEKNCAITLISIWLYSPHSGLTILARFTNENYPTGLLPFLEYVEV